MLFCKGSGSGVGSPLICMNCIKWSNEYKSKVPCHVCKDTRIVYKKECNICKGTGKLGKKEWTDLMNDGAEIMKKSKVNTPPISDKPMSVEEYQKFYNANTDASLQGTSASSQYPTRPKQDNVLYVEILDNKAELKIAEEKKKLEEESNKKENEAEVIRGIGILKTFFDFEHFNISVDSFELNSYRVKILRTKKIIILKSFKIQDGFLIENTNGFIYNKDGVLIYDGNLPYYTFHYKKNTNEKVPYIFFPYIDKQPFCNMFSNYKGEIISKIPQSTTMFFVDSLNEIIDFDIERYSNYRFIVTRVYSETTVDLADVQYDYQIMDLENSSMSRILTYNALKRQINKLHKRESSIINLLKTIIN